MFPDGSLRTISSGSPPAHLFLGCALVHPDLWTQPPNTEVQGGCSCVQCCLFFVSRPQLPPSSPQARPTVGLAPTPQKLCCSPTRNQDYPGASWPCRESADGDCFWIRLCVVCCVCVICWPKPQTHTHTTHNTDRPRGGTKYCPQRSGVDFMHSGFWLVDRTLGLSFLLL